MPTTLASTVADFWRALAADLSRSTIAPSSRLQGARSAPTYLEALYSELVEPVEDLIAGERLLIVPHGSLFYLPFHAFRVRGKFLGDQYPLSYAPSATAYHLIRARNFGASAPKEALASSRAKKTTSWPS